MSRPDEMNRPDETRCDCPAGPYGAHTTGCFVSFLWMRLALRGPDLTRTVDDIVDDTIEELTSDDATPTLRDWVRRLERDDRQRDEIERILRALDWPNDPSFPDSEPEKETP